MNIKKVELFHIRMPLKFSFKTSQTSINYRESIVIKVTDNLNNTGYGEVVTFNEPFYTNETLLDAKTILIDSYIPKLFNVDIKHPFDIHRYFDISYPMTIAGLENSLLYLYSKINNKSIMEIVFNEECNDKIYAGVTLGDLDIENLLSQINNYLKQGYIRFKIKIKPEDAYIKLKKIREYYPNIKLLVDANRSFSLSQVDELIKLDSLNLLCIEEPLNVNDMETLGEVQDKMVTPICLDESILSINNLNEAIKYNSCKAINIKVGRLGGMYYTKKMINICRENNIKYWIGSMIESGISKILHVHLASLKDTYIPGDLSASNRYFEKDIIIPEIEVKNGIISVPEGKSCGVTVDDDILKNYTIDYIKFGGE